jgi:hypothetical protein
MLWNSGEGVSSEGVLAEYTEPGRDGRPRKEDTPWAILLRNPVVWQEFSDLTC